MAMRSTLDPEAGFALQLRPAVEMSDETFLAVCAQNPELRLELTAEGEIVIMPPAGSTTSQRNAAVTSALYVWAQKDGTGVAFDSSAGFRLPNGAIRGPDAAWVRSERLDAVPLTARDQFPPLCPDFVIELRSPSDRLATLQAKMEEYVANGIHLGWLVDPFERAIHVYRPGCPPERLAEPERLSGDPELPGFVLDLGSVWPPLA